jgi:hypothetical protein
MILIAVALSYLSYCILLFGIVILIRCALRNTYDICDQQNYWRKAT